MRIVNLTTVTDRFSPPALNSHLSTRYREDDDDDEDVLVLCMLLPYWPVYTYL